MKRELELYDVDVDTYICKCCLGAVPRKTGRFLRFINPRIVRFADDPVWEVWENGDDVRTRVVGHIDDVAEKFWRERQGVGETVVSVRPWGFDGPPALFRVGSVMCPSYFSSELVMDDGVLKHWLAVPTRAWPWETEV